MKIACIYSLLFTSLSILSSVHAVRGRSLVRGAAVSSNHRFLEESDAEDEVIIEDEVDNEEELDNEDDIEEEEDEDDDESPIAPKKRDCKMRQMANEVIFECKAKSDDVNAKVKDEIDYSVSTTGQGLQLKIKYEQEIELVDNGEEEDDNDNDIEAEPETEDESDTEAETDIEADTEEEAEPQDETTDAADNGGTENEAENDEAGDEIVEFEEQGAEEESIEADTPPEGERVLQAEQETETQFEVIYDSIIEYTKGEGSSGEAYDWENDVVLQTISLDSWDVFSEVAADNETSQFTVTSPDGRITFTFTINQAATGEHVTANKMKIDFELKDFPWTSDDSFVALLSTVETERQVDVDYGRDEDPESEGVMAARNVFVSFADVVDTSSFTPFGEYSWAETAEATSAGGNSNEISSVIPDTTTDEESVIESPTNETDVVTTRSVNTTATAQPRSVQTIRVVATSPVVERADRRAEEGKQVQSIAYSFVGGNAAHRASMIYWDPTAGVDYQSSARPLSLALAGAGIVLSFLALF